MQPGTQVIIIRMRIFHEKQAKITQEVQESEKEPNKLQESERGRLTRLTADHDQRLKL